MFGLEDVLCCKRYNDEEEVCKAVDWNVLGDGKPMPKGEHHPALDGKSQMLLSPPPICMDTRYHQKKALCIAVAYRPCSAPGPYIHDALQNSLSIMNDWAAALRSRHDRGIIHGKLTPEAVDVVNGRGILVDRGWGQGCMASWGRGPMDDEVYDARWTATEFFRLDNGNPQPTKMSDVYSFGCLMLQMLTGSVPYCGTTRPEQVVYLKYLGRGPIDAQTPKIPDHYVAFMQECWSLEPEKRPTMEAIVGFLQREIKRLGE